jgi:hypothetical protein
MKESKQALLFVNKKTARRERQKNVINSAPGCATARCQSNKSFLVLFFKKELLALLLASLLLTGCGRKGPPVPPGPATEITYPQPYPSQ